jgi:hypothetical protein
MKEIRHDEIGASSQQAQTLAGVKAEPLVLINRNAQGHSIPVFGVIDFHRAITDDYKLLTSQIVILENTLDNFLFGVSFRIIQGAIDTIAEILGYP